MTTRPTTRRKYGRVNVKETEQMLRAGMTQKQVVAEFTRRGEPVSQAAISGAIKDGRIKVDTGRTPTRSGIPWTLLPKHRHYHAARMLRSAARQDAGLEIGATLKPQLAAWQKTLVDEDAVIHYDPDTDEGFWLVPRRHGVDKWWVREPDLDDEGNLIR